MDINLSVDGFGAEDGDGLAMNCTNDGNISVEYEKYSITPGIAATTMNNLSDTALSNGMANLTIVQNQNDNGNSTNLTYWKMMVPIGVPKGTCNGTVTFSAVPAN